MAFKSGCYRQRMLALLMASSLDPAVEIVAIFADRVSTTILSRHVLL